MPVRFTDGTADEVTAREELVVLEAEPAEVELGEEVDEMELDAELLVLFMLSPYILIREPAPQYSALDPLQVIEHLVSSVSFEVAAMVFPQKH